MNFAHPSKEKQLRERWARWRDTAPDEAHDIDEGDVRSERVDYNFV